MSNNTSEPLVLEAVELVPVLEVEAFRYATYPRPYPSGSRHELPLAWQQYWTDSLADSGITGLAPITPGSEFIPTAYFTDLTALEKVLAVIVEGFGGVGSLEDPDSDLVLCGGVALRPLNSKDLLEPQCCTDFRDVANWRAAAPHRGGQWEMLWIGHPWLSVRFLKPWMILSHPHESDTPVALWAVPPDELLRALDEAEAEVERFAPRVAIALRSLEYVGDHDRLARQLLGLPQ
jgi:hypothetical protein